jgi:hypothetical protein
MTGAGSTVVRRQLGKKLRSLRTKAGKSSGDVRASKAMSEAKLWRIESGLAAVKIGDVLALCRLYGMTDGTVVDQLVDLAEGTESQGWWEDYGNVLPQWFRLFVGLEAAAAKISTYDPELVSGLLQTPEYARAVFLAYMGVDSQEIQQLADVRAERQKALLGRVSRPAFVAIMCEGVLARQVGGPEIMERQRQHLLMLSERGFVDCRVLTWETGAHAAMESGFTLFDFDAEEDPTVAYVETHAGARCLETPAQVAGYREIWRKILQQSIPFEEYLR